METEGDRGKNMLKSDIIGFYGDSKCVTYRYKL